MKIGTDGVLLGAWADGTAARSLLDIGAGTGILSLMMAQRFPELTGMALEPDEGAFSDLYENIKTSAFAGRIMPVRSKLQDFESPSFDYIISNPPYFESGLVASGTRGMARHTTDLTPKELLDNSIRLLSKHGKLGVILPFTSSFISLALKTGLFLNQQCIICLDIDETPIRRMMEFSFIPEPVRQERIYSRKHGTYSVEYISLTKDFYLDLK